MKRDKTGGDAGPDRSSTPGRGTVHLSFPRPPPPVEFKGDRRPGVLLQYYAPLYGVDSYANVSHAFGHALARALAGSPEKLSVCNYVGGEIDDPVLARHAGLSFRAPVGVFHGLPHHAPDGFFEHVIRIGLFVCETDRVLPEWVRVCNRLHLIVVPSRFCRLSFLRSGVTTPIMVVPHGVHPEHAPRPGRRPDDRFVFYNAFRRQAADRKGYPELLRCFQAAFQGRDDVVLRLRAGNPDWLPNYPGWPDYGGLVEFDEDYDLTMDEAAAVYSEVHCTVHPSKGEGFGLMPLESMACETPVIVPAHTGLADYVDEGNAVVLPDGDIIKARRTEIQCGRWFAVDEAALVDQLVYVFEHWETERDKLAAVAGGLRERYAWSEVLKPFIEIVEAALDCGDAWEFSRLTEGFRDPEGVERYRAEAETRARSRPAGPGDISPGAGFRFSSIVYCGWDYPRDGVGNHLRLLDSLVFNDPGIRYKSLEELPSAYDPELYPGVSRYVHEQRPDLFRGGLYLDVVGFHGDQGVIRQQIERVTDFRRRFEVRTAIYLMWESDRLWAPVLELVNAYDLTIVTSSLLEPYLNERGVRYSRLPHPYKYVIDRPTEVGDTDKACLTMGICAGLWPRKNLALVAETFAEVLGNQPGYRLEVHTRTEPRETSARMEHQRIEEAARSVDNIVYRVESFTRAQYIDWMKSLDIYCFLSSGEGWSVTPREALHLGKPVVLLDAHVHADFCHLPGVIRVPPGPLQPARPGARFIESTIGNEAGVDVDAFRQVLSGLRDACRVARENLVDRFDEVLACHNMRVVQDQWINALNNIFD